MEVEILREGGTGKTGPHGVQADLELDMKLNFWSSCLYLLSAEAKDVCQQFYAVLEMEPGALGMKGKHSVYQLS